MEKENEQIIEINAINSPFVFKPIKGLINKVNYSPITGKDRHALSLIFPFDKTLRQERRNSHLTDRQIKEKQLRFLGRSETEDKLRHLAQEIAKLLSGKRIKINFYLNQSASKLLFYFIKSLNFYSGTEVIFDYSKKSEICSITHLSNEFELFYFSEPEFRIKNASLLYEAARDCGNAGDFESALNLLNSLLELDLDSNLYIEVLLYVGLCHRLLSNPIEAEFYFNKVIEKTKNIYQRNTAWYALAMISILGHQPKFKNLSKSENYLQKNYEELCSLKKSKLNKAKIIFNRNGYALTLFRRGKLKEALEIVEDGVRQLDGFNTKQQFFQQTVLYYNIFQCYLNLGEISKAETTILKLINSDPKFPKYRLDLAEMYLQEKQYEQAIKAVKSGIKECSFSMYLFYFLEGKIFFELKEFEKAIKSFKIARKNNPFHIETLAFLVSSLIRTKKYKSVFKLLKNFDVKNYNNDTGETILNCKIVAMLNLSGKEEKLKEVVLSAQKIRPSAILVNKISQSYEINI